MKIKILQTCKLAQTVVSKPLLSFKENEVVEVTDRRVYERLIELKLAKKSKAEKPKADETKEAKMEKPKENKMVTPELNKSKSE